MEAEGWFDILREIGGGITLAELQKRMSHREYLVWLERLQRIWNIPTKQDYYLAQIAAQVQMSYTWKHVPTDTKLIKFKDPGEEEKEYTPEEIHEICEARRRELMAMAMMGRNKQESTDGG